MRHACLDIGSNTLLLLVVDAVDGQLSPVLDECRFGRLSQHLDETGQLSDEAVTRCLGVLREYRKLMDQLEVTSVVAVGTEALRKAGNADAFLVPARDIVGTAIEVIDGHREAELVFEATCRSFPDVAAGEFVVADVGGASTEIVVGNQSRIQTMTSVPIGAVRLSERHLQSDPITADQARALVADIDAHLGQLDLPTNVPIIGTAGTATSLASVELKLREYDAQRVQGYKLAPASVDRLLARFLELSISNKRALVGLEPKRADVIAGGAAIYARLVHRLQAPEMIVSDRGLRWGLAYAAAP